MEIPIMYVGASSGGQRRALVDHLGAQNPVSGNFITAKAAAYTITNAEFGCIFSNTLAGGSVTFTLPTPEAGAILAILKTANQTVVVSGTVSGGTTITNNTSGQYGSIVLIGLDATTWQILAVYGTWSVT